jgi:hypothetical protein
VRQRVTLREHFRRDNAAFTQIVASQRTVNSSPPSLVYHPGILSSDYRPSPVKEAISVVCVPVRVVSGATAAAVEVLVEALLARSARKAVTTPPTRSRRWWEARTSLMGRRRSPAAAPLQLRLRFRRHLPNVGSAKGHRGSLCGPSNRDSDHQCAKSPGYSPMAENSTTISEFECLYPRISVTSLPACSRP